MRSRNRTQSRYGIHHGMNLRDAIAACRQMGGTVIHPRRRGDEIVFAHRAINYRVVGTFGRKDTSRAVTTWLMRVERELARHPGHQGRKHA